MSIYRLLSQDSKISSEYFNIPTSSSPILSRIIAVTDGSLANAGDVGEVLTANVAWADAVTYTTNNTDQSIVTLNLTAGYWLVSGNFCFAGSLGILEVNCGLNLTASTTGINLTGFNQGTNVNQVVANSVNPIYVIAPTPVTVYLVVNANVNAGTNEMAGSIMAQRVA